MTDKRESWLSSIIVHGKWYLLTSLLTKGVNFFLLPVYTSQLSTAEYGALSSINAIGQLVAILISLYIDSAFGRYYHEYKEEPQRLKILFSTTYFFVLIWGPLMVLGILVFSPWLLRSIITQRYVMYAALAFAPHVLLQISQLGMVFLRQSLHSRMVALMQIGSAVVSVTLTILLLYRFNFGFEARLIGNGAAGILTFVFFTVLFIHNGLLGLYFNLKELKIYLLFSLPLLPNVAGNWIASMSDRIIITHYDSLSSTGIYSFTFQLAHIIYIIQDAITQVLGPVSMSELFRNKELALRKICSSSRWLYAFMLHISLGAFLFGKEAISLVLLVGRGEPEYLKGFYLIPLFALVYVFSSQYRMFTTIISYHKKNWVISSAGLIMAGINLGLNLLFVPRYGRTAAVIATMLSTLVYTLWIILWAKRFDVFALGIGWYIFWSAVYGFIAVVILLYFPSILVNLTGRHAITKVVLYVILSVFLLFFWKHGGRRMKPQLNNLFRKD